MKLPWTMTWKCYVAIYFVASFLQKTVSHKPLAQCSELLCRKNLCPETTCECSNYASGVSLHSINITCPNFPSIEVRFNVKAKDFRVVCTEQPYHPRVVIEQIIPLFKYDQIRKLRICLFDDELQFPNITEETISNETLTMLKHVRELEISVQHGQVQAELMQYFSALIPSLGKLLVTNTAIDVPQDNALKVFANVKALCLHGTHLSNITAEAFRQMKALTFFNVSRNDIQTVPADLLWNLTYLKLIDFSYNELRTLPPDLFRDCTKVEELGITNNNLEFLSGNLLKNMKSLKKLCLRDNKLTALHVDLLRSASRLVYFDVSRNNLQYIPDKIFQSNSELNELLLNDNKLRNISVALRNISKEASVYLDNNEIKELLIPLTLTFQHTKKISLNNNCLKIIDKSKDTNKQKYDKTLIKELHMRNCCLTAIPRFLAMNVQVVLDLGFNELETLNNTQIIYSANLQELDLRYNKIQTFLLEWNYPLIRHAKYHNPITQININNNPVTCDCKLLSLSQFIWSSNIAAAVNFTNLKFIAENVFCNQPHYLKNVTLKKITDLVLPCNITNCPSPCQCSVISSLDVIIVDCSHQKLETFPEVFPLNSTYLWLYFDNNLLSQFSVWNETFWLRIQKLFLHNNFINSTMNFMLTPQLKNITLHGNRLSQFEPELKEMLSAKQNVNLTLANNSWTCNCEIMSLKRLVFSSGRVQDQKSLQCSKGDQLYDLANITTDKVCERSHSMRNDLLIFLCVSASLCVVICAAAHHYRDEIRLWLFTRGLLLCLVSEDSIDNDKEFDAFVSYSGENEEWVMKTLVPELEDGEPSYTLCVHTRDWAGGLWIPEQIERSVANSRRILVVFSKEFVQSCWSRMEFHAAYRQSQDDKINRLVVLVLGEIPPLEDLDSEMRIYLKLNTYIKWGEPHFWRKLKCAMPRRRTPNSHQVKTEDWETTI